MTSDCMPFKRICEITSVNLLQLYLTGTPSGRVRLGAAACHLAALTWLLWWQWVHCIPTNQGVFYYRFVMSSRSLCSAEALLLVRVSSWNFVCVCPKACFGHAHGISAWGSHRRGDFGPCIFCEFIFGEFVGCWWNIPLESALLAPGAFLGDFGRSVWLWMVSWSFMTSQSVGSFFGTVGGGNVNSWFVT